MARTSRDKGIDARVAGRLVRAAKAVRRRAYAPYSGFKVGAAVLDAAGRIHSGANVENASSPSALCAEQAAVAVAVAAGARRIVAVAVAGRSVRPVPPCGRCLQVLVEFGPGLEVLLAAGGGGFERLRLAGLLPRPFRR
jgi:cytidine deaminase